MENREKITRLIFWLSCLWWLGLAVLIFNQNAAPSGRVHFAWGNPVRSSANFHWQTVPATSNGQVVVYPDSPQRFSLTLPRGFQSGELRLEYDPASASQRVRLSGQARTDRQVESLASGSPARLTFPWTDLIARGRTFDFELELLEATGSIQIRSIEIIARR